MLAKTKLFVCSAAAAVAGWLALPISSTRAQTTPLPNTGMADPATLMHLQDRWAAARPAATSDRVTLSLIPIPGLSAESPNASGSVTIDVRTGEVASQVRGLPAGEWDLWLIDNASTARNSTLPDADDLTINVGRYRAAGPGLALSATLPSGRRTDFEYDRAAVTRPGVNPTAGFVLLGGANFHERWSRGWVRLTPTGRGVEGTAAMWQLVARGRSLFTSEPFGGNGRTCGSCHSETNNFTSDAASIAALPASDPLFVHERTVDLNELENAQLLRRLGLFVANVDGLEEPTKKLTLRPAPSLLSIGTQSAAPSPEVFADFTAVGAAADPPERLGWGNDNLPLRDFAMGAILQHMPRTLARRASRDFRVPSDDELDALAAYQLSLGRQEDFDLKKLELRVGQATAGQRLYLDTGEIGEPGHKNCNACHFNGGGTSAFGLNPGVPGFSPKLDATPRGFNATIGTNVNGLPASIALGLPPDGGFGAIRLPFGSFGNFGEIPGVGVIPVEEFNSMSVVESADTAPFFHNHAVATLEESIAFYGTAAYQDQASIGDKVAGPVPVKISSDPRDPEVLAIATFLRVLNALENVRSAVSMAERARRAASLDDAKDLARLAREEAIDGFQSLSEGSLGRTSDLLVLLSRGRLGAARIALEAARDAKDAAALESSLVSALESLRSCRDGLAKKDTLPLSFQK